jgi:hypothetical protein
MAARKTVSASITIHILAVPREPLEELPAASASHSARDEDSFCQKSELAIKSTQTSNFLKCLDYRPLGLMSNAREAR